MFAIPDDHYAQGSDLHIPGAKLKDFADFAADPKNAGQIFDAPQSLWGHTIKFYFKKNNQQRYQEFLEGLQHTFGKEVVDTSIPLENRKVKEEPQSLSTILTTHFVDHLLETLKPTLNKQLKNIRLDLSIPENSAEKLPHPQGWVSQLIRTPVTEALQDTKRVLNRDLKDISLNLSIRDTPPPDHPLGHREINQALQKNYLLFSTYVSYVRYASLAAQTLNKGLQELTEHFEHLPQPEGFSSYQDLLESSNEATKNAQQIAVSVTIYAQDVAKTLKLDSTLKSKNELMLFFYESAQKISKELKPLLASFQEAEQLAILLGDFKDLDCGKLTPFTKEHFLSQKEKLTTLTQEALQRTIKLVGICSRLVSQFHEKLSPQEHPADDLLSVEELSLLFCEEFDLFQKAQASLEATSEDLHEQCEEILDNAALAVEAAKKNLQTARTSTYLPASLETYAARAAHREKSRKAPEGLAAQAALEKALQQEQAVKAMFSFLPQTNFSTV